MAACFEGHLLYVRFCIIDFVYFFASCGVVAVLVEEYGHLADFRTTKQPA